MTDDGAYSRSGDYRTSWDDYPPVVIDPRTGEVRNPQPNPRGIRFPAESITVSFDE